MNQQFHLFIGLMGIYAVVFFGLWWSRVVTHEPGLYGQVLSDYLQIYYQIEIKIDPLTQSD